MVSVSHSSGVMVSVSHSSGVMVSVSHSSGVMVSVSHSSGVMVSVSRSIAVDYGFAPLSSQTRDCEIGICCFSAELRSKSEGGGGETCLPELLKLY
jgi:hypothetical protein